jgi:hypothetical protein
MSTLETPYGQIDKVLLVQLRQINCWLVILMAYFRTAKFTWVKRVMNSKHFKREMDVVSKHSKNLAHRWPLLLVESRIWQNDA